ncbi:MAG TPA: SPOR domain-containing protein [Moraxellaceae bacterium]
MNFRQSPLMLGAALASFFLLLVFVVLLAVRERSPAAVVPMEQAAAAVDPRISFPKGFGTLAELVPFSGGIAPMAAAVVAVEHAAEFRDEAWVRGQNPEVFTIQVMAAKDEEVVKRFLASQSDRSRYSYFLHTQDGANWYVVTTGSFATIELARGIADSQDFGTDTKPFPKRMSVYQQSLAPAASAQPAAPAPAAPVSQP